MTPEERQAAYTSQQRRCDTCNETHHYTSFCPTTGKCFFSQRIIHDNEFGDFVICECGKTHWWD